MNILTVEDDLAIREAIAEVLSFAGYDVQTASHGKEALDLLRSGFKPSVILLDLMMPVMDGWQFVEEVSKDRVLSQIPIVIISAVSAGDQIKGRPNVKDTIRKPIIIEQLLKTVKDISDFPQLNP